MQGYIYFCAGANEELLPAEQVDALLVNTPQDLRNEVALAKTRRLIATAGATYVMQDSGGFQFYTVEQDGGIIRFDPRQPLICRQPQEINLSVSHIVDAAMKLKPTVLTGLDWPVNKLTGKFERDAEFMKKFGYNIKWIQEMVDLRAKLCPEILLYLPAQFYDLEQFHFYEIYLRNLAYDGISLPTRNLTSEAIILLLIKFYTMGVRRVHLLSVSNLAGIAIACYFARNYFISCTTDATTWRKSAQFGTYLDPQSLKRKIFDPTRNFRLGSICRCPWCSYRTYFDFLDTPQTQQTYFLRCHNYFVITEAGKDLWEHSQSAHEMARCLTVRVGTKDKNINQLIQALTTIEIARGNEISIVKDLLNVKF